MLATLQTETKEGDTPMATIVPQERELAPISRIQRITGRPDDPYEVIFLNREVSFIGNPALVSHLTCHAPRLV